MIIYIDSEANFLANIEFMWWVWLSYDVHSRGVLSLTLHFIRALTEAQASQWWLSQYLLK